MSAIKLYGCNVIIDEDNGKIIIRYRGKIPDNNVIMESIRPLGNHFQPHYSEVSSMSFSEHPPTILAVSPPVPSKPISPPAVGRADNHSGKRKDGGCFLGKSKKGWCEILNINYDSSWKQIGEILRSGCEKARHN